MKKYGIFGALLAIYNISYAMNLDIAKQSKEEKTPDLLHWPTVDEKAYIPTIDLSNRALVSLEGFSYHMPSTINGRFIRNLNVSHCSLSAIDVNNEISCLPNLEYLDVSHNNIVELLLAQKRLKRLIAHHNKLQEVILNPLPSEETDLSDNIFLTSITLEKKSDVDSSCILRIKSYLEIQLYVCAILV